MQRKVKNGIHWLQFDLLADIPNLKHAVLLRHGGVSEGPYTSLNLGDHVGDNTEDVSNNLRKVVEVMEVSKLIYSKQCHGISINEIKSESIDNALQGDALTTVMSDIGLMIHHADCQAAIIYDPIHHAVANVHAGWRGNVQNIYSKVIQFMKDTYGSNPKDLLVCISPSLGPEHSQFINYRKELPEPFWDFQIKPEYFDLWEISRWQLTNAGVLASHIEIASICTYANPKDYFSYRRDHTTGRHGTFVALSSN